MNLSPDDVRFRQLVALAIVVLAAVGVAIWLHFGEQRAPAPVVTPSPGAGTSITLAFNCTVTATDSYTMTIVNNNAVPVTADVTTGFYDSSGTQMGQDEKFLTISANSTYDYRGSYFQFELGGIPASCAEIQWLQQ